MSYNPFEGVLAEVSEVCTVCCRACISLTDSGVCSECGETACLSHLDGRVCTDCRDLSLDDEAARYSPMWRAGA